MNSKRSNRSKLTLEVSEIIQSYKDGQSTTEIAEKANVSSRYIRQLLNDNSVEMRPRGSWKRKYHLNEDYFKTWSDNMAYILGFILADGNINGNTQSVTISQKHKEILEDIKQELQSDQPIMETKRGLFLFHINSSIIRHDLLNLHGLTPNKSLTVEFPKVPEKYLHHFERGYFDGDGSVYKKGYMINFVGGSYKFMLFFHSVLRSKGFDPIITSKNKTYRIYLSGRLTIKLFSDWIYEDARLFLQRKFDVFAKENLPFDQIKNTSSKTATRKRIFLKEYAIYKCVETACKHVGVNRDMFEKWLQSDCAFNKGFHKIDIKIIEQ
ncbi:LAGLIDADG family homing endonuclease [Bacillus tianshenii]|uniref:LAGLIDADG family homing endonuclease n=1 Tax=Sutcliffiella tianshenii TaxID=1463404 RepID=UPI001CD796F2|nr:LAGLIDADG family homing endonuclease [Bacillus tianshenii]MCA1319389.1 LAGLIDADG family homing endonuclease [Bacillus tianshenii]